MSDLFGAQNGSPDPLVSTIENTALPIVSPSVSPEIPLTSEQETFLNHISWGLLFLGWLHLLGSNLTKRALLMFIPIYGIYIYITGIFRARRMSWETGLWKDFASFEKQQRLLDKIGIIWASIVFVSIVFTIVSAGVTIWAWFRSVQTTGEDILSDISIIVPTVEEDTDGNLMGKEDTTTDESDSDRRQRYLDFAQSTIESSIDNIVFLKTKFSSLDGSKNFTTDILPVAQEVLSDVESMTSGYSMSGIFSDDDDLGSGYDITLSVIHYNVPEEADYFTMTVIQKDGRFIMTDFEDVPEESDDPALAKQESETPTSDTLPLTGDSTSSGSRIRKSTPIDLHRASEYVTP